MNLRVSADLVGFPLLVNRSSDRSCCELWFFVDDIDAKYLDFLILE